MSNQNLRFIEMEEAETTSTGQEKEIVKTDEEKREPLFVEVENGKVINAYHSFPVKTDLYVLDHDIVKNPEATQEEIDFYHDLCEHLNIPARK